MSKIRIPKAQVFPVLRHNILVDGFHIVVDLDRSKGAVMVDALHGKQYLDCFSYFASLPIGHNPEGFEEKAFRETLLRSALTKPTNSDIYTPEYAGFVETFRRIAVPDEFAYMFFIAGGALAVENAMKAAFDWKARKNRAADIQGGADKILHFEHAFHGRSGYTLSVTNTEPIKVADFPQFDWPRVSSPAIRYPIDADECARSESVTIGEIETAFAKDPHGIAAILIEPIQSEGGDRHFRPEFLQELRRLADEHEALLIFDEVQTGIGMTGSMWAWQQFGVTPDLIAFGKKTQVCGILSTRRIDEVEDNVFHLSSRINSTWGGDLVDMVRFARILEIIEQDRLVENAATVGAFFLQGLWDLQSRQPLMSQARGRGLMLAFDLPDTETRNQLRTALWDAGLATLSCGPVSVRFRPSLIFSKADVTKTLDILEHALAALHTTH